VRSGVPEQPFEAQTWEGARARAREALVLWPEADFGVGIEAGLFRFPGLDRPDAAASGRVEAGLFDVRGVGLLDVQACAVADRSGRVTFGSGPGFAHPPAVEKATRAGRTVGDALGDLSGDPDVGRKDGAVGWLSHGHVTRTALTEPAVLMAFLPRLRPELYGL
jgi:inosine/xanthosine triphosphatase